VLVIRGWIEGEPPSLRLRITQTLDVAARDEKSTVTADVDEACAVVRRWLEALAEGTPR
jgi:hypothetical protein